MNVIITMAGNGRRFREAGYGCPKYEIMAHGRSLFEWSMASLNQFWAQGAQAIFLCQAGQQAPAFIDQHAPGCGIARYQVLEIDGVTDGQATTAWMAQSVIENKDTPVIIFNIDTYVDPAQLNPRDVRGQGWVPCFSGQGDGWSFAKVDEQSRVLEMREKVRISEWATIGLYHFASFELYERLYAEHFATKAGEEKGERYIAPMYNTLLRMQPHASVYIAKLSADAVIPMGTPAELQAFLAREAPEAGRAC